MTGVQKVVIGGLLFMAVAVGALFGVTSNTHSSLGAVPVAHAECDNRPPPGGDCPVPTPTPTPPGGQ